MIKEASIEAEDDEDEPIKIFDPSSSMVRERILSEKHKQSCIEEEFKYGLDYVPKKDVTESP